MKLFKLLLLSLIVCASCKKDPNRGDEPLCSERSVNNSSALRLGGIYYFESSGNPGYAYLFILNANGTVGDTGIEMPLKDASNKFSSPSFRNFMSDNKSYWGVYHINGSRIHIDTWKDKGDTKDYGYRWSGDILTDTSFQITSGGFCDGSNSITMNKIYYFYPVSNKPDSVTSLIP